MAKLLISCSTKINFFLKNPKKNYFEATEVMSRKNFEVEYLCEFEAIFKNILGGYLEAQGWLNVKKPEVKNLVTLSL